MKALLDQHNNVHQIKEFVVEEENIVVTMSASGDQAQPIYDVTIHSFENPDNDSIIEALAELTQFENYEIIEI